jgi:murein DD-endopeptidase MepM/ murein hydrolase activator NlpD
MRRTLLTLLIAGVAVAAAPPSKKTTAPRKAVVAASANKKPRVVRRRAAVSPILLLKARYVQPDLSSFPEMAPPLPDLLPSELQDSFFAARVGRRVHQSIDIMRPSGTPLLACVDGFIEKIQTSRLGGKSIYVTDPERRHHFIYAHLSGYAEGVVEGMPVTRGTLLGYVGNTGNARFTGPHLHFQIMRDTGAVNPYPVLRSMVEGFIPVHAVPPAAVLEGMPTVIDPGVSPEPPPAPAPVADLATPVERRAVVTGSQPLVVPDYSVPPVTLSLAGGGR